VDPAVLTDAELIRAACDSSEPAIARDAFEELARRCLPRIRITIRKMVYAKQSLCPPAEDAAAFLDDAVSLASRKLFQSLGTFGFRAPFDHWLTTLARSAAIDQHRRVQRDQHGQSDLLEEVEQRQA
jgi:DNA-directed RNA polymerase specialized sigma24 family protein